MLTAKDAEIDKVVGLELGADDYVTKPYSSRELVARVRAVLRRQGEPEELVSSTVQAGPVRMDIERHVVSVSGEQVSLPLKEFELLEMLLRNSGRVLTRGPADRPGLGLGLCGGHQDPGRPRQAAAQQDRAGSLGAAVPDHRPRPGLQVRALSPRPGSRLTGRYAGRSRQQKEGRPWPGPSFVCFMRRSPAS